MTENDLRAIESALGYGFNNIDLLQQAFVRRSYSQENGGQNNEVLEFIGDKALDLAVIKILMQRFGEITEQKECQELKLRNPKYFVTKHDEGEFTNIKADLVNRGALAKCIDRLEFNQYLIMGKGDIEQNVQNSTAVKEDLFEAIIGAVAVDCDYDMQIICEVTSRMIDFDGYFSGADFVDERPILDLKDWADTIGCGAPEYNFIEKNGECLCSLEIQSIGLTALGAGKNRVDAQADCALKACEILDDNKILADEYEIEVGVPERDEAIQQLNDLKQKNMIFNLEYKFEETENEGEERWYCVATAENIAYNYGGDGKASTKKEAQKTAAFDLLLGLMKYEF